MRADHPRAGRIAAVAALVAASVIFAVPASAHDELVGSDPPADAQLAHMPAEIELTYSGELMELGAVVEVRDAAGVDHAGSAPVVSGTIVTVPVDPAAGDGAYVVVWRVVSSDGHPISGAVPFSVGETPPAEEAPVPDQGTDADLPDDDRPDAEAAASDAESSPDPWAAGGWARLALVAAAGAALALGILTLGITLGRRRPRADVRTDTGSDPTGSSPASNEQEER